MKSSSSNRLAAVVLAAGASVRMGESKQLLKWDGVALVRRAAEAALAAGCGPVVVVIGSGGDAIRAELHGLAVGVVHNSAWATGMGSSIGAGIGMVEEADVDGVAITLCDQPGVDTNVLRRLIDAWANSAHPIAAAGYAGSTGVPAVFDRTLFGALLALDDASGAKPLLRERADAVLIVPMPEAEADIDTPQDYAALGSSLKTKMEDRR